MTGAADGTFLWSCGVREAIAASSFIKRADSKSGVGGGLDCPGGGSIWRPSFPALPRDLSQAAKLHLQSIAPISSCASLPGEPAGSPRGNIGLVEQQTGRPSKKSPAEAGLSLANLNTALSRCGMIPTTSSSRSRRSLHLRNLCRSLCSLCSLCNPRNLGPLVHQPGLFRHFPCRRHRTFRGLTSEISSSLRVIPGPVAVSLKGMSDSGPTTPAAEAPLANDKDTRDMHRRFCITAWQAMAASQPLQTSPTPPRHPSSSGTHEHPPE